MNRKFQLSAAVAALALCVIAATPLLGQVPGQRGNFQRRANAPLAFLKQALSKAGAPALSSDQETALNTAITNFRSANKPAAQNADEKAARDAYANAILTGNGDTAIGAADNLAALLSARQKTMLEAQANFEIQALSVLTSDQVAALQNSIGNQGILRVLDSLAGPGGGRFGRGMMGGPRMMRP
jgi:Spy/CpxP family protein refolding chaperone